jgi:hypothetical protein
MYTFENIIRSRLFQIRTVFKTIVNGLYSTNAQNSYIKHPTGYTWNPWIFNC